MSVGVGEFAEVQEEMGEGGGADRGLRCWVYYGHITVGLYPIVIC